MMPKIKLCLLLLVTSLTAESVFVFKTEPITISKAESDIIKSISSQEWLEFTQRGIDSDDQEKRLERNLVRSNVIVQNGSISHVQLLDTLPNAEAQQDSEVADKILKTGLYIYNRICATRSLEGQRCEFILSNKDLPASSELARECKNIIESRRNSHSSFRRLLPRFYKDGFYKMYTELPTPLAVSREFCSCTLQRSTGEQNEEDRNVRNLAVVQWAQFIGNDLSKPVATTMSDGSPIECCNKENYKLQPRHIHPACAPLTSRDSTTKYGRESCLTYVRSALAVGSKCTFAAPEQLNQATGSLDMSPLYGFTESASHRMRVGIDGLLKSTVVGQMQDALLPVVTSDKHLFCVPQTTDAAVSNSTCFMAGDSRVNSNPFAIVIFTILMRNHNRLAVYLKRNFPAWNDDQLFDVAKHINTDTYRAIVFDEWLPIVLGSRLANDIKTQKVMETIADTNQNQISNEYAVAAERFYLSMLPDALQSSGKDSQRYELQNTQTNVAHNIEDESNVFVLKDAIYNSRIDITPQKVNEILDAVLQQGAMPMDAMYVESLISDFVDNKRPTHIDMLAFDIQRGRDHGLQPYYKYLEICNGVKIRDWNDLSRFMASETIDKLKTIYTKWQDIDLILGGISELPAANATVGPTFQCLMGEQFAKLFQWHQRNLNEYNNNVIDLTNFKTIKAADLLCLNSNLKHVPTNIFLMPSEKNPLISCAELISKTKRTL